MPLFIPEDYTAKLAPETMEQAITYLKEIFPDMLARRLRLRRVTAPLFVLSGTGINDDLNGVERAVSFPIRDLGDRRAEVVHSLAKWKRMKLGTYKIAPGYGLYTDMNAIRADEELDNIHSLYVDQWDWERTMRPEERNLNFLKATVETIYEAMKAVEEEVYELYPHITPILPERITFLQAEELLQEFPALTPKEREQAAARKYGALFLIGIGLSMDAFAVSICKGLSMQKIDKKYTLCIGLFFGGFQALMPLTGYLLGSQFSGYIERFDHWIAFVLLALIGFNMIKESREEEEEEEKPYAGVNFKELLILAVATSIDALAVGVTFAFLQVNIVSAITIIGCTTFVISIAGVYVGNVFGSRYKSRAELTGGVILILIGLKILLEHLGVIAF